MSKEFWRKHLSDGSFEFGYDSQIESKKASWTMGRQDIMSARMSFAGKLIQITNHSNARPAEWKQLDGWVLSVSSGINSRVNRQLKCSVNGKKYLRVTSGVVDGFEITLFDLNDQIGQLISYKASYLVCIITIDGKVDYRWE